MAQVLLCADQASLENPALIGLDGETLDAHPWLHTLTSGMDARAEVSRDERHEISEIWVSSSDDVDGINLAAALKHDRPELPVYLIALHASGSSFSRSKAAGITEVLSPSMFAKRYHEWKAMGEGKGDLAENAVAIDDAVTHIQQIPHKRGQAGTVISVVSGSGGVGRSALAAVLACEGARRGIKTVLLDADLQFGDEEFYLGVEEPVRIGDVLADPAKLERLASKENLPLLVAAPQKPEEAELFEGKMEPLLAELTSRFKLVVVNTGGSWTERTLELIERSNKTIMLMDQRTSSIRACQRAHELCLRCGIATGSLIFLLNRCSKKSPFTSLDISCALQGASVVELRDGGYEVEELLASGLAAELVQSKNWFARSVRNIWSEVFDGEDGLNRDRRKPSR